MKQDHDFLAGFKDGILAEVPNSTFSHNSYIRGYTAGSEARRNMISSGTVNIEEFEKLWRNPPTEW